MAKKRKRYTEDQAHGAASKFGQMIGGSFADAVIDFISGYLAVQHPEYVLLEPDEGKSAVRLEMFGGTRREMDNVIALKDSDDPVALFESKWLKDGRHHNDKGAWILQFREIRKNYATVRGAAAVLAGYWKGGVQVMFRDEAGVDTVMVATDEEVYSTLSQPVSDYVKSHNLPSLTFDVKQIRDSLPRPWDFANCLLELQEHDELKPITATWLEFERDIDNQGRPVLGRDLIQSAVDGILRPLLDNPKVAKYEIALQIDTGNTIYAEFSDIEAIMDFITNYADNPQAILDKITPKKRSAK